MEKNITVTVEGFKVIGRVIVDDLSFRFAIFELVCLATGEVFETVRKVNALTDADLSEREIATEACQAAGWSYDDLSEKEWRES